MINTAKRLFDEINETCLPNTRKPELGAFTQLVGHYGQKGLVNFAINWYDLFEVQFNPKTVKVVYTKVVKDTKEKKSVSKQFPIDQENLLDAILEMYKDKL